MRRWFIRLSSGVFLVLNQQRCQMSIEIKYRILPHESKRKTVTIPEIKRDASRDLDWWYLSSFWVAIMIVIALVVCAVMIIFGFTNEIGVIIGCIIGIVSASIAVPKISSSIRNHNIVEFEQEREATAKAAHQAAEEEYQNAVRLATDEATSLTSSVIQTYRSSTELSDQIRKHIDHASLWLRNAENEYNSNAFGPFWDAVEQAALHLSAFNEKAQSLYRYGDEYYSKLKGRKHTFPAFPIQNGTIPDTAFVTREFQRVVRLGQTNFQFANIWEHRRTREVLIAGFRTLGEAVNNLGATIEYSLSNLQDSISSDVAKLVEEEIKTRDTLDKRMMEQNRMLDNIQHHREPRITDTPSRY